MSGSRSLPGQAWLIKLMQRIGYKSAATGICFGVALMAAQALVLNDIGVFDERMWQMFLAFQQNLPATTDMLAFLDGVELNQQPWFYPEVFPSGQTLYQASFLTMHYVQSIEMKKKGMAAMKAFSGAYTENVLPAYFASLLNAIESSDEGFDHPVTMVLRTSNHTVTVAYHAKDKTWLLINPSGKLVSESLTSVDQIAAAVHKAFDYSPITIFSTTLYSAAKHARALIHLRDNWLANEAFRQVQTITTTNATVVDKDGATRLSMAVSSGDAKLVRELLANGAKPDKKSFAQHSALSIAASMDNAEIAQALVDAGATVDIAAKDGDTPLLMAARSGASKVVDVLLKAGANIHATRDTGIGEENALYLAVYEGYEAVVKQLLKAGANPEQACTNAAWTPLRLARYKKQTDVIQLIEESIENRNQSTMLAPVRGNNGFFARAKQKMTGTNSQAGKNSDFTMS